MPYFVRDEETLDRAGLIRLQRRKLAALLADILPTNAFYRRKFEGILFDPKADPITRLPLTTRAEIQQDQADHPPCGELPTYPLSCYNRQHQTSGSGGSPLRWLDNDRSWSWWKRCWGIIYRGAGVTSEDRLFFPFSFGPFIGFWAAFDAAICLGNMAFPAGGLSTRARLRYMLENKATVVCCTPTYALRMAEVAKEDDLDLAGCDVRSLIVAGEPGGSIPATRSRLESAWGARVFDHIGMTEIGPWGFECVEEPGVVLVMESEFIAEVIAPDTGEPVEDGQPGELVLTNLGRFGMPLVRYRTGDRAMLTRDRCWAGRWFARAEGGVLGRLDDMLIIRGQNVFPAAVEGIVRAFDQVAEFRLVVDERGAMTDLCIEVEPVVGRIRRDLALDIASAVRDRFLFKPTVRLVEPGILPRFELKAKRVARSHDPEGE